MINRKVLIDLLLRYGGDYGETAKPSSEVNATSIGFSFIELMIILAVLTITLTLAIPRYSIYSTRAKINQSLVIATQAKYAVEYSCQQNSSLTYLSNQTVDFNFKATEHLFNLIIGGNCNAPTIEIVTQDTGAQPDPVLFINGKYDDDTEATTWHCVSGGRNVHLPASCRS